ncbi:TRAM domain-containing protein, partial [Candidatus Pacearchaeota archaeon]|nr:TRAM domain-containing protein [Candidatus Pacearchaeota archaeon]
EKQVESKIARKRTLELQKLHLKINLEENEKLENSEQEVFVNEKTNSMYFGRTKNYKIVIIKSEKNILGKTIKVRIKQAFSHYFLGEIV